MRRLLLIAVLALGATGWFAVARPAAAPAAQGTATVLNSGAGAATTSPFAVGLPQAAASTTQTATAATTTTSTSTGGGFSGFDGVLVGIGVALVLVAIGAYVWWDSRSAARRLRHGKGPSSAAGPHSGSKPARKPRKLSAQEKRRRKRGRAPRRR